MNRISMALHKMLRKRTPIFGYPQCLITEIWSIGGEVSLNPEWFTLPPRWPARGLWAARVFQESPPWLGQSPQTPSPSSGECESQRRVRWFGIWRWAGTSTAAGKDPLVVTNIAMERSTHFSWENPLFLWPFSIAMLNYQRVWWTRTWKMDLCGRFFARFVEML